MSKYISDTFISEADIQAMVKRLGAQISADYQGEKIIMIAALKGAFMFMADLVREIKVPVNIDFMAVSSYGHEQVSSGIVKILKDCDVNLEGQHVIVVEDIIDTGLTLSKLVELLQLRNPKSLQLCTAFDKPSRRIIPLEVKYRGIEIPDAFIVGYGLDYLGYYRNLPSVCVLSDDGVEGDA